MTSARENKMAADAEMCMNGFVIPVESELHAQFIVDYILHVLFPDEVDTDTKAEELVRTAMTRYASKKPREVRYITVSSSHFGRLLTFVVDKNRLTKANGDATMNGNLCWVQNLDHPDLSELGYCFFKKKNGKVVRFA